MKSLKLIGKLILLYAAGFLGSFCLFGLSLALLWALGPSSSTYMLVTSLISASIAFLSGGFIFTWLYGSFSLPGVGLFGVLIGGFGALYILGQALAALGFAIGSGLLAILGGFLYQRLIHPHGTTVELGAS